MPRKRKNTPKSLPFEPTQLVRLEAARNEINTRGDANNLFFIVLLSSSITSLLYLTFSLSDKLHDSLAQSKNDRGSFYLLPYIVAFILVQSLIWKFSSGLVNRLLPGGISPLIIGGGSTTRSLKWSNPRQIREETRRMRRVIAYQKKVENICWWLHIVVMLSPLLMIAGRQVLFATPTSFGVDGNLFGFYFRIGARAEKESFLLQRYRDFQAALNTNGAYRIYLNYRGEQKLECFKRALEEVFKDCGLNGLDIKMEAKLGYLYIEQPKRKKVSFNHQPISRNQIESLFEHLYSLSIENDLGVLYFNSSRLYLSLTNLSKQQIKKISGQLRERLQAITAQPKPAEVDSSYSPRRFQLPALKPQRRCRGGGGGPVSRQPRVVPAVNAKSRIDFGNKYVFNPGKTAEEITAQGNSPVYLLRSSDHPVYYAVSRNVYPVIRNYMDQSTLDCMIGKAPRIGKTTKTKANAVGINRLKNPLRYRTVNGETRTALYRFKGHNLRIFGCRVDRESGPPLIMFNGPFRGH